MSTENPKKKPLTAEDFHAVAGQTSSSYKLYQMLITDFQDMPEDEQDKMLAYMVSDLNDFQEAYSVLDILHNSSMENFNDRFSMYNLIEMIHTMSTRDNASPLVKSIAEALQEVDDETFASPRRLRAILQLTFEEHLFPEDPLEHDVKNPFTRNAAKQDTPQETPAPTSNPHTNIRAYLKRKTSRKPSQ